MKYLIGLLVGFGAAYAAITTDLINFNNLATISSSPQGRIGIHTKVDNQSSAIDIWPTTGAYPSNNSVAELTLHKTTGVNIEQMNFSVTPDGQYRFGVEREGTGQFYDIIFCYENYTPGVADCLFKITTTGVYVNNWTIPSDRNWVKIGGKQ